jgi:hypothetical protein
MAIDKSGKWWIGETPEDIRGFLESYATKGYKVHEFRPARCTCGAVAFVLDADDNEGVARRTCSACGAQHFICDSEEFWADASPETCSCPECGSNAVNVGVGFSLYRDDPTAVRWLYVGVRCSRCGVLGCFAGWKVATGNALHLLGQV